MKLFSFCGQKLPPWGGVVVGNSVIILGGATDTGWHRGRCGTSGPTAKANSVALGGLQLVYQ